MNKFATIWAQVKLAGDSISVLFYGRLLIGYLGIGYMFMLYARETQHVYNMGYSYPDGLIALDLFAWPLMFLMRCIGFIPLPFIGSLITVFAFAGLMALLQGPSLIANILSSRRN